jgi:WD40 repeat protein
VPNPYHVRLAISQYGDRFRAELFTEDLGDTDGELLPADWRDSFTRWLDYLQGGGKPAPESDADIGGQLFDWLFGGVINRTKWNDVLGRASRDSSRPVRLLIDSSTLAGPAADPDADRIHNLPYGLLFDRQRDVFVFRPQPGKPPIQYVRIVRRCTPRLLNLERARWPLRVLLAVAEPEGLAFAGTRELARLAGALTVDPTAMTVFICTPDGPRPLGEVLAGPAEGWTTESLSRLCRTTPEQLRSALAAQRYDLLHLIAHGSATGLLLCGPGGQRAEVRARELCEWCKVTCSCSPACVGTCRLNPRVQMAFLQVCRAAGTRGQGCFGGLAQKLINPDGGDLAAVVASPYVLEADQSTTAAVEFYARLARGESPDQALFRNLAMANWAWAFLELWVRPSALSDTGARGAFQFVSPYRGLDGFKERDADVFFGREEEVETYREVLANEPVLVVAGESGSGKSSVLYAGLAHRVRRDGLAGMGGWRIVTVRPGREPARNLMAALLLHDEPGRLELPTPKDWEQALTALLATSCGAGRPLLLFVDQFEEMFTLCADAGQREAVAKSLAEMAGRAGSYFRLVVGTRNDYLGQDVTLPGLGEWLQKPRILRPPTAEALRAIVARPAEVSGYRFEGPLTDADERHRLGLLERILADPVLHGEGTTEQKAAPLPLLGFALEQLWLCAVERGSQEFTHADYDRLGGQEGEQLGGLGGAIARHAQEVYRFLPELFPGLGQDAQKLAEELFTSLVSPTYRTRTPCRRKEIEERSGRADAMRALIDHLVGERLLTIRSDPNDLKETQVDLAHEVLIKRWGLLREWLDHDRGEQVRREEFRRDAARWDRASDTTPARSRRGLPGTETQTEYLNWVEKKHPSLTESERAFAEAMRRHLLRRKWLRGAVVAASLVIAVVMAGLAWFAMTTAENEKGARIAADNATEESKTALELATNSQKRAIASKNETLQNKYISDLNLIQAAWAQSDIKRIDRVLNIQRKYLRDFEWYYWKRLIQTNAASLPGSGALLCVAASPDSQMLAAGSDDGSVWLWKSAADPSPIHLKKYHNGPVWSVAFSSSGKWLASGSADASVKVWNVTEQKLACTLTGHTTPVWSVTFSPKTDLLASGSENRQIKLWNVGDGKEIRTLWHENWVRSVAFSPDGVQLAGATPDGLIRLWNVASLQMKQEFKAGSEHLWDIRFSPKGSRIAVASGLKVLVCPLDNPKEAIELLGHTDHVVCVDFGQTDDDVISASLDRTIKIWKISRQSDKLRAENTHTLRGHRDAILNVCVGADRKTILSSSSDSTVRIWTDDSCQEPENLLMMNRPRPHRVLTADAKTGLVTPAAFQAFFDRTLRVPRSPTTPGKVPAEGCPTVDRARGLSEPHNFIAFSQDGHRLASWYAGQLELWDVPKKRRLQTLSISDATGNPVLALDQKGRILAKGSQTGPLRIWQVDSEKPLSWTLDQQGPVRSLAFGGAGALLAVGGCDDKVVVWDMAAKTRKNELSGHRGPVWALAFSPDGQLLATGDEAGAVRCWDLNKNTLLWVMKEHEQRVWSLAFSGERFALTSEQNGLVVSPLPPLLASASEDTTVRIWDIRNGQCHSTFTGHTGPVWTVAFNADNTRTVSSGKEKTIRIWEPNSETAQELLTLSHHAEPVWAVSFCADESLLATAGSDGRVFLWRAIPYHLEPEL